VSVSGVDRSTLLLEHGEVVGSARDAEPRIDTVVTGVTGVTGRA
jgi:hypothetical protein